MLSSNSIEQELKTDVEAELKEWHDTLQAVYGEQDIKVNVTTEHVITIYKSGNPWIRKQKRINSAQIPHFKAASFVKTYIRVFNRVMGWHKHKIPALPGRIYTHEHAQNPAIWIGNNLAKDNYWIPANALERKLHPVLSKKLDKLLEKNKDLKNQPPKNAKEAEFL